MEATIRAIISEANRHFPGKRVYVYSSTRSEMVSDERTEEVVSYWASIIIDPPLGELLMWYPMTDEPEEVEFASWCREQKESIHNVPNTEASRSPS